MENVDLSDDEFLSLLRPLTLSQYDDCKVSTVNRVKKLIGEKPERKKMQRDMGPLLNPLDWLAIVVFIAAFLISSLHILTHIGSLSKMIYREQNFGISISENFSIITHQVGFIFLAESSMLLFMTTYRISLRRSAKLWQKILNVYLVLSLTAMVFIILANFSAGLTFLESLMPPIFTIGLSLNLERLIVELLDRRITINQKYQTAISTWEQSVEDPTQFPNYKQMLIREIWERLSKMKDNHEAADATTRQKIIAVNRELQRDAWADEAVDGERRVENLRKHGVDKTEAEKLVGRSPLLDLVKLIREGKEEIVQTDVAGANLGTLVWTDFRTNKNWGPYKTKQLMILAIQRVAKNEEN